VRAANITAQSARGKILQAAQIHDVNVVRQTIFWATITINRSSYTCRHVYNTPSVAALGIAAHESGHAIQHAARTRR